MPVSGITASDIVAFAAREGNKMIEAQVNMKAKVFAALDKVPMKGKRAIINVINGGLSSTSQVVDFGALPSEAGVVPAQGFVDAVGYVSRLGLGRIALQTLGGVDDSADLLDLHLQIAADDMARQLGRAVFGSQLASPQANATWVATTGAPQTIGGVSRTLATGGAVVAVNFDGGIADFREGEAYLWEPNQVATTSFNVLCIDVSIVNDTRVQVTFLAGVGGVPGFDSAAYATTLLANVNNTVAGGVNTLDQFFLRGSRATSAAGTGVTRGASLASPVSLADITSSTAALHGLPAATNGWTGISFGAAGAGNGVGSPTAELFMGRSKILQARGGVAPTHLVLNPLASVAYAASQIANGSVGLATGIGNVASQGRRNVDGKLDKYGKDADLDSGLSMFGRPVLLDDNCPVTEAYLLNKDYVKVGEWKKLSAEDEGGSPLLLSRSTFSKEVQFSCIYNLVCRKRNAHARMINMTI